MILDISFIRRCADWKIRESLVEKKWTISWRLIHLDEALKTFIFHIYPSNNYECIWDALLVYESRGEHLSRIIKPPRLTLYIEKSRMNICDAIGRRISISRERPKWICPKLPTCSFDIPSRLHIYSHIYEIATRASARSYTINEMTRRRRSLGCRWQIWRCEWRERRRRHTPPRLVSLISWWWAAPIFFCLSWLSSPPCRKDNTAPISFSYFVLIRTVFVYLSWGRGKVGVPTRS